MPIRFRCPGCEGLLSIATRKAGSEIACPKCGEALIVPPPVDGPPDPEPEPAPPPKRPEPAGVGAGPKAKPERRSRPARDADTEMLPASAFEPAPTKPERPPPPPDLPRPAPAAKPKDAPGPHKPGDTPLFERSDFEKLLIAAEPKKAPEPPKPAPTMNAAEALKQGLPVADDGVYISRGSAIMLGALLVVLLGLAFAAGYLIGS